MDLREVAAELYASDPSDFIARRGAAASETSDKALAKQIRTLRKPSAAAAAINALVHEHPEVVAEVLDVGDRMRDAFAARDRAEIRALTQERQKLLHRATSGLSLSAAVERDVEETLQAAVIDPAAAAAVRSGMLLRALESTGVEQVDVSDAVALPIEIGEVPPLSASGRTGGTGRGAHGQRPESSPAPEPRESASERRERERRIRTAERALDRARSDAEALDDELDAEVDRRSDLEETRDDLQRRLQRTMDDLAESRATERDLRKRITEAQRAVREAERALRDAQG